MKNSKHILVAITAICLLVLAGSRCMDKNTASTDPRGEAYAGDATCSNCHKNIHASFLSTAHNKSSSPANRQTVKGNFAPPLNAYFYRPDVKVVMEQRDSGLYEVAYMNGIEKRASRFDIAVGSGRKAQTYLYWDGDKIFQLPVSWSVVANSWVNSPNYPPHQVRFDRNIPIGCFECHGSYIKVTSTEVAGTRIMDNFDKNGLVYGIDCERCHGPAARHALFHETHPGESKARYMVSYSSLSLQQKTDMCAVCHSGIHPTIQSTFHFTPGDTLDNHFFAPSVATAVDDIDVHGNQTQLMKASQCYIKSASLTCTSCHDTHTSERNNMVAFSLRCMHCHNNENHNFCTMAPALGASITNNCIDCHMPAKPSRLITLLSNGQSSPAPNLVRTHFISIYPEATRRFIALKK